MFRKASLLSLVLRLVPLVNVPTDRFLLPPLVQLCSAGLGQTCKLDYITHCCNTVTILSTSRRYPLAYVYTDQLYSRALTTDLPISGQESNSVSTSVVSPHSLDSSSGLSFRSSDAVLCSQRCLWLAAVCSVVLNYYN